MKMCDLSQYYRVFHPAVPSPTTQDPPDPCATVDNRSFLRHRSSSHSETVMRLGKIQEEGAPSNALHSLSKTRRAGSFKERKCLARGDPFGPAHQLTAWRDSIVGGKGTPEQVAVLLLDRWSSPEGVQAISKCLVDRWVGHCARQYRQCHRNSRSLLSIACLKRLHVN